jgi:Lon protease-like protein
MAADGDGGFDDLDADWSAEAGDVLASTPLFPLPGMVLFPRAVLPLHIFEERYRQMVQDALAGDRLIAMCQPKLDGDEDDGDFTDHPALEPICGLGRIGEVQRMDDGRYNLLLHGVARVRLVEEDFSRAYRRGDLEILAEKRPLEIDLDPQRQRLTAICQRPPLAESSLGRQFARLLAGPLPVADIADVLAFELFEDARLKQRLLEEVDAGSRVEAVPRLLAAANPDPTTASLDGKRTLFNAADEADHELDDEADEDDEGNL